MDWSAFFHYLFFKLIPYTSPADGRLTYQSDRHACICCCHISRLRQRSDISDSHSFARRCLSVECISIRASNRQALRHKPISILSHVSRFEVRGSLPFARRSSPSNGVPCLCLSQEPERVGSHTYKKERIHIVYVFCWRSSHLSVGSAPMKASSGQITLT